MKGALPPPRLLLLLSLYRQASSLARRFPVCRHYISIVPVYPVRARIVLVYPVRALQLQQQLQPWSRDSKPSYPRDPTHHGSELPTS